ncbi:tetratricopeptide repeat protein [Archangium gephyra]|uniref:Tetratricopeptide repeat domain protein n=1 Tax=Archangium gephyra TaxID=48 RepID=A0AAC8QGZ9_9BACT|nr:tetratricopeptide repeat protein [Archangium gephyra]AKJ07286.1 Tetratricopeptide repeat domain protein [Archangium gephyra]REG26691.1 tetratricopeptide repeat protein [Archangium gephyra]
MDPTSLERLRRKVEAGEPLNDAELEVLRTAAQNTPGPTLRLAVAHALVNAGAEREALRLLEVLRRDFPQDVQVRLGLARALLGLERPGDAEAVLREALVLNPGDPEAQKVLAVLALRRGEHGRAREYVADVLRRDPFDEEARLLEAELEAADVPPPPAPQVRALRPEFTAALLAALHRAGVACRRQGKDLLVKLASGEVGRVDVASLYVAYRDGSQDLDTYVRGMVTRLRSLSGLAVDTGSLETRLRPVLRPGGFETQAAGALHRPGPAGLAVFYVLEDAEFVHYLPGDSLEPAGLSAEAVDALAWRNLEAHPAPVRPVVLDEGQVVLAETFSGLWAVAGGDGYDGARLLTAEQRGRLVLHAGEVPLRVHLGWREFTLVCRESDVPACEALARLGGAPDGIPGLFRLEGGTLTAL